MTAVLDASAALAVLRREPGHEIVTEQLAGAVISTVNWSEVVQKGIARCWPSSAAEALRYAGVRVLPFTAEHALRAAELWPTTRTAGLSLGDRACLAVAAGIPEGFAVTADRAWGELALDVRVQVIR